MREVNLFFVTLTGEGLTREQHQIPRTALWEEIKATLQALAQGSQQGNLYVIPPRAQVREVYLDTTKGTAYVDFTAALRDDHQGGSWWELLTIYSIVNSLTQNFPEVKRVQILVEGKPIETLAGHIRTDIPLEERLTF
jgi:spore germination protein GerM